MTDLSSLAEPSPADDDYRLTTSFPYLVRRVGLRIGELFDRAVAPLGVDVSVFRVIAALAEVDGQQLGQLSAVTTIELSTLSRLIGSMVQKGLVTRRRPRGNGRIVEISLSVRGRRLADELVPIAVRFEAAAVSGMTKSEVARLKAQLGGAYRNLDALESAIAAEAANAPVKRPARGRRASRGGAQS